MDNLPVFFFTLPLPFTIIKYKSESFPYILTLCVSYGFFLEPLHCMVVLQSPEEGTNCVQVSCIQDLRVGPRHFFNTKLFLGISSRTAKGAMDAMNAMDSMDAMDAMDAMNGLDAMDAAFVYLYYALFCTKCTVQ